jgi:hypothetical protein
MRILLKILAAPFVLILAILSPVVLFLFTYAKVFLQLLSGLAAIAAVLLFIGGQTPGGIAFTVIAFLISPLGLPAIAEWIVVKLYGLNYALRDFMTS